MNTTKIREAVSGQMIEDEAIGCREEVKAGGKLYDNEGSKSAVPRLVGSSRLQAKQSKLLTLGLVPTSQFCHG